MRTMFSLGVVGAHSGSVALAELGLDAPVERVVLHQLEVDAALALLHSLIRGGIHTWGLFCRVANDS